MIYKKILRKTVIASSLLFCVSCTSNDLRQLKQLEKETGFLFVKDAQILFSYNNVGGFDKSGCVYYLMKYQKNNNVFLNQFKNKKSEDNTLKKGRDSIFETAVEKFLEKNISEYNSFNSEYKIDWKEEYEYYCNSMEFITLSFIYYSNSDNLFILNLQM